ncbi:hypothetical protein V6N11_007269 [Hibiscus sabdariffa]|uniref:Uncharacterized protein n=1 Tax=Hibiscus sabdariffa TaxID=183260 RepID=A0ABR2RTW6_9ROSI
MILINDSSSFCSPQQLPKEGGTWPLSTQNGISIATKIKGKTHPLPVSRLKTQPFLGKFETWVRSRLETRECRKMSLKADHYLFEVNEVDAPFEPILFSIPNDNQDLTFYSPLCFHALMAAVTINLREHVMSMHDVCEDG